MTGRERLPGTLPGPASAPAGWSSLAFLGSTASAIGFVASYATGQDTQVLGTLLAVAVALLGLGLVWWAKHLLPTGTYVEERPAMEPPDPVQDAFVVTLERGSAPGLLRRTLMLSVLGLGAAAIVPLRSLFSLDITPLGRLRVTGWTGGARAMRADGDLVRPTDLDVGTALTVFPKAAEPDEYSTALLIRLAPERLATSALDPSLAVDGIVGFSKLCTHAGCPVGLYEQTTNYLLCPCHQSAFDVLRAAAPVNGPAARPLPQLPLTVDDQGYLASTGDFHGQVGPTYWRKA